MDEQTGRTVLEALKQASAQNVPVEEIRASAIHRDRESVGMLPAAEIREALTAILCGAGAEGILLPFPDVLAVPVPELAPMVGFDQRNPHHDRDVWAHTAAVVSHAPAEPVLRWAALLHDVGKPACFSLGADGTGHFYGHAGESTRLAEGIASRLDFEPAVRDRILTLIRYHDLPIAPEEKPVRRLKNRLGADTLRQLIALHMADTWGQAPICRGRLETYRQVEEVLDGVLREESRFSLKDLAVNGRDLTALGLRGRLVGNALRACLDAVTAGQLPNDRTALLTFVRDHLTVGQTEGSCDLQ